MPKNLKNDIYCQICNAHDVEEFLTYEHLKWRRCKNCLCGFIDPYIGELESDDTNSEVSATYENYENSRDLFVGVAQRKLNWIAENITTDSLIIEIGPGVGVFASLAIKSGYKYVAIEPSTYFSKFLKRSGIAVLDHEPMSALQSAVTDASSNCLLPVVFLDNVLEHVPHPIEFLKRIRSILPTGSMVFIEVPNERGIKYKSILADFVRGYRKPPTFPGHINLFNAFGLRYVVEKAGFSNASISGHGIREISDITYLSQSVSLNWKIRSVVGLLRLTRLDSLLGLNYWLRAILVK